MDAQASSSSGQQMAMPSPATTITNLHLRPQQEQYNDMARFLGYSSGSSSLPSPQQNHSQASSQAAFQALPPAHSETAGQATRRRQQAMGHAGLYPNDHAVDLPVSRPYPATRVTAPDSNPQPADSSMSSTSMSSQSSRSSHDNRQAERQPGRQAESQPHQQSERQAERQPERQQTQTPVATVAASPFMANAEHSFAPVAAPPVNAFTSPFMADAAHSFVPHPAIDQQEAPPPWDAFGSPTFPSRTQAPVSTDPQGGTPSTHHPPANYPSNNASTNASPPTNYFSYLDLLGPRQAAGMQALSQQPHDTQGRQGLQAQMPHPHRQHRQHRQQQGQNGPEHVSAQHTSAQHASAQQPSQQHPQERQQHRQQQRHDARDHQNAHHLRQAQPQPQVRPGPFSQLAGLSEQPSGPYNDPPIVPPRSAFDSFDTSGKRRLYETPKAWACLLTAHLPCVVPGKCTVCCIALGKVHYLLHCSWQKE